MSYVVSVYVVHQHINVAKDDEANSRIIAARLTKGAAQTIVDSTPGTWIEKLTATK